jgi:hypothetical protein
MAMKAAFLLGALLASLAQGSPRAACTDKAEGAACSYVAQGGPKQGQTMTGTCASGSCDSGSGRPTGGPSSSGSSSSCPTDSQYTGNTAYINAGLKAAPLRGNVACVDAGPLATRPKATVARKEEDATNIYGPNEAGFTSAQPGMSCLGTSSVQGGIDTNLAEAMVHKICGESVQVLDTCGGHAVPYHYHEKLACLYSADATTKHSTRIGTALDGHGIYGKYIAGGVVPTDLDACGGRVGVTPDSNGAEVYYYPVTDTAPFTLGCFANKAAYPVSVAQCKALYSGCSSAPITVTTAHGSGQYILDCPCFDKFHSNVANQGLPGYLDPKTPTPGAATATTTLAAAKTPAATTTPAPAPATTTQAPKADGNQPKTTHAPKATTQPPKADENKPKPTTQAPKGAENKPKPTTQAP